MSPEKRPDRCHHRLRTNTGYCQICAVALFDAFKRTRGQRAGARPAALAERAERACSASGTTSKTGSAALDQCPVGRQLLVGDASSLRAATPSCGFSRSSTHRAPWGVAPATPRTNRCVSCAAALSSPSSSSSLWAQTKLALSCGFSRSSTHRAPWGVAPATPRTNRCVSCAAVQSSPSSSSSLWAQTSAASSL